MPLSEVERDLVSALNELIPVFKNLDDRLQTDLTERQRFRKVQMTERIVIGILLLALLVVILWFHRTADKTQAVARNTNDVAKIVKDCTVAPKHPSPVGTPFNQLTCFERNQVQTSQAVGMLLQYEHDVNQQIVNAFGPNRHIILLTPQQFFKEKSGSQKG